MTNKPTTKRLVVGLIVFATGLVTLIALSFPLLTVSDVALDGKTLLAKYMLYLEKALGAKVSVATGENGFSLMDFSSSAGLGNVYASIGGLLAILTLLLSIATMAIGIVTIFVFDENRVKKLTFGFAGACLAVAVIYCIYGIVVANMNGYVEILEKHPYWRLTNGSPYDTDIFFKTYTRSYLALILVLPFAIAAVLCQSLIKEQGGVARSK